MNNCNIGMNVASLRTVLQKAKNGDREARKRLIVENIGFAESLSLRYRGKHNQNIDGLVAEALLGLIGGVDYLISHDDFESPKGVIANFVRVAMRDFIAHDRLFPVARGTFKKLIESGKYPKQQAVEKPTLVSGDSYKSTLSRKPGVKDLAAKISEPEFNRRIEDFMADADNHYRYILRMVLAGYKDYEIAERFAYSQRFIGMVRETEGKRILEYIKKKGVTHG